VSERGEAEAEVDGDKEQVEEGERKRRTTFPQNAHETSEFHKSRSMPDLESMHAAANLGEDGVAARPDEFWQESRRNSERERETQRERECVRERERKREDQMVLLPSGDQSCFHANFMFDAAAACTDGINLHL
jgi:hypothetical protein